MNNLRQIPLLRLAIPLILGIAANLFFNLSIPNILIITAANLLILFSIQCIKKISENYSLRWIYGLFVHSFFLLMGIWIADFNKSKIGTTVPDNQEMFIMAKIVDAPSEKDKTIKTFIEVICYNHESAWLPAKGRALAYIQKDSLSGRLELGDEIIFRSALREIKNPGNPFEFDYKKYLSYHFVSQQAYIKSGMWRLTGKGRVNPLFIYADKAQKYLLEIYKKSGLSGDEFAVASALTIGYTDKIDVEVKRAYSATGAMHILSVSGLHVGIVFVVFNFLLFFLDKFKHGKIIKAVIIILLLWFYAMLTGLSAAVIRAAAMFTFVVIGRSFNRPVNIYNTLAASLIVLLVYNPFYLADIGFQLSYLAVLGIVFFQPRIYKLAYCKNWLLDKIWALVSVSIAAQLITFPLCLYNFHQFPNYFLITNILVIPVSTVILYAGIALFIFSFWSAMVAILGKILYWSVFFLNGTIIYIEHLPYSISGGIQINPIEVLILYLMMVLFALFFINKNIVHLKIALVLIAFFLCGKIYAAYTVNHQKQLIVYNIPGKTAIEALDGKTSWQISDTSASETLKSTPVQSVHIHKFIADTRIITAGDMDYKRVAFGDFLLKQNFIYFCDKRIFILKKDVLRAYKPSRKFALDYLIVSGSSGISLSEILVFFDVKHIIIDSSGPRKKNSILKRECARKGIDCFDVNEQGAFVLDL
ncbi:MAG: ComEC family competence protein [Bacteroidia bacterium]|nr:ComEC family competence protein [Bacteroidia bacterium]